MESDHMSFHKFYSLLKTAETAFYFCDIRYLQIHNRLNCLHTVTSHRPDIQHPFPGTIAERGWFMKELYIIREINLTVLILLIQEYTPKVQKVLPRIKTIQFLHILREGIWTKKVKLYDCWTSLFTIELHLFTVELHFFSVKKRCWTSPPKVY